MTQIEEIRQKASLTKYARFAAYRRFKIRIATGVINYNLFGVFVILGSAYLLAFSSSISKEETNFLSLIFIILSLSTLVFQMLETSQQYEKRSNTLYRCGMALSEFTDRLQFSSKVTSSQSAMDEYHKILRENEENHDRIDHHFANREHYKAGSAKSAWLHLVYFGSCAWMFALYTIINAVLIYFSYVMIF